MQLEITGHHIDITTPLSNHVNKKISRLKRHFDQVLDIHVILKVKKLDHTAEAICHFRGNRIFAEAKSHDMYVAIDLLADKLERQVLKHKEKTKSHHNSEGSHRNIEYSS